MSLFLLSKNSYFDKIMTPPFQMHFSEYMLGDKMPDSPDTLLSKSQLLQPNIQHNAHKYIITQNSNGTLSPRPPSSGRSPSPSMSSGPSSSPTSSHRLDGNGLTSKGRQVVKIKRFLSTLQQFANDISSETGDKVRGLILGLVAASVSIEEFHQKIQEVTNYPLRPFAIPFLKTHLPLLQTEVLHFSRMAKQSPQQYLRYHENVFLDTRSSPSVQHATEPFEIFLADVKENGKRISPANRSGKGVADLDDSSADGLPPAKRRHSMSTSPNLGPRVSPAAPSSHLTTGLNYRTDDPVQLYRDNRYDRYERIERDFYRPFYGGPPRDYAEEREMEEEWRNIHTMLNCILGMVEKTKRALAILQHRSSSELSHWPRVGRILDGEPKKAPRPPDIYKAAAEDRASEGRRRAGDWQEAVNEVKRQAVAELQKAVSAAEAKAHELVSTERVKMERLLSDARRQAAEEALATASRQEESEESCWNCGREAHETCSGCNKARYCGSFCQHKNWDAHLRVCGQISSPSSLTATSKSTPATSHPEKSSSPSRTSTLLDVKSIKTDL